MNRSANETEERGSFLYLSALGAWALAFGCSVGWGAFVMPGTTFLPIAGPLGTAVGIGIGGLAMLVFGRNYHFLMNRFPDGGGTYTYTKKCFGYDHGFLSAWFLILTYIAIIWANATALPLIARALLGRTFQFGFDYTIAGFHVYFGEILLAVASMVIAAVLCLRRRLAERTQILMAVLLFGGVVICFVAAAAGRGGASPHFMPPFSRSHTPLGGIFLIFALAPWAFVGFESISHSAAEAKFPLRKAFRIMAAAVVTAAAAYILLVLLSVTALPVRERSWVEYISHLGSYQGITSFPTFFAANSALGKMGLVVLGVAALCGIFTGLIGNYIALSRLIRSLSEDGLISGWIGELDTNHVPWHAILCIMGISVLLPFFGRTAISWIVDVTTVGATIAYTFTSACAWKLARQEKEKQVEATGMAGLILAVLFALIFLVPNLVSVKTLSTESYLILAAWGLLGFLFFRRILRKDTARRLGRSTVTWVILLGLIIFASTVWVRQATEDRLMQAAIPIHTYYEREDHEGEGSPDDNDTAFAYVRQVMEETNHAIALDGVIQMVLIIVALFLLFQINSMTHRRERQIEVEKALAEESSRAKTSFLSNMSHEIRTPMNAIIGLDNIALRDPDLPPRTREHLEKIGSSAKHLLGLINDILDMSRIESGRMVLKNEEFSFREFLDQINIIINGQCVDKGLHYECYIAGPVSDYYTGDDMKLKQVLINILGNSVKFTDPPGEVTLTVEQVARDESGSTLRFIMKDTGMGMDQAFIPRLFEAFSQEDATTTNRYGGSGLGMAITKNFVEMMNGEIAVESQKGVGSTFTVTVTLKASSRTFQAEPLAVQPAAETAENILSGRRILMAEDMDANAEILADLLELEDILSERAENGQRAVDMFSEHPAGYYDAVLMDVRMPIMDGLSATQAIRALNRPDANEIPIIAMTANVFDEDVERSLQAGMNAHLFKPIEPDRLYETMARLIENSRQEARSQPR